MKILVISSANMDFVMKLTKFPSRGETITESGTYDFVPGGKGANSALTLSRLGAQAVVFCAGLGNDRNGQELKALYDSEGIDTSKIVIDSKYPTGLATIMLEADGSNRIVVYPGANFALTEKDVDIAFECEPDAVFMQLEIPSKVVTYASRKASEKNIPVIIDAGPADKNFPLKKLSHIKIFSPNETETEIFTGISPNSSENCLKAAMALECLVDADYYVIKLGARGAYLYFDGEGRMFPAFHVEVADTTAAGDAFTAALALEYLRTSDIFAAIEYASAVGAITVSRFGASTSIPNAEDVEDFLFEINR